MLRRISLAILATGAMILPASLLAQEGVPEAWSGDEIVYARIQTSEGDIDLALNKTKAPITVENFFAYAEKGYYDRTIFHRVVPGTLVQGGGYTERFLGRPTEDPIENEATNGLDNERGTIALARHTDPHSATNQWFINLKHNKNLDHENEELMMNWGYAVFGRVVDGMEVADAIGSVETSEGGPFDAEVPVEPITITRVDRIEADEVGASE